MINKITFTSLLLFLTLPLNSFSAQVITVKGSKVLIDLQGLEANVGDEFYGMNAANKRKAILKISQVKNGKAVAEITKGTPEVGFTLKQKVAPPPPSTAENTPKKKQRAEKDPAFTSIKTSHPAWGAVLNVFMNTMSASFTGSTGSKVSTDLKGNSFGVNGLYDYPMSKQFYVRALGGYDQYQLSGSTANNDCDSSTQCTVNVSYLSGYGIAKYNFSTGSIRPWVGAGLGYLFALSKASTLLKTSEITSNLLYILSLGIDIQMGKKNFMPLQFDYGIFPSSDTVKATSMIFRIGWGWDI